MVIWTPQAQADLKDAHDYIKKDNPQNAKNIVQEMRLKADRLSDLPRMGKVIPELGHDDLHEIQEYPWRILYHIRRDQIHVFALVHKRQLLDINRLVF